MMRIDANSGSSRSDEVITFFFDYVSPYAYLAWTQVLRIERIYDVQFRLVPVLFAGLLNAHGQKGPAEIPAKRRWMIGNVLHHAAALGVPIRKPAYHPFNPLLALRITAACDEVLELRKLVNSFFRAIWVNSVHMSEPDSVKNCLNADGLIGSELVRGGQSDEAKLILHENTGDAIAAGVFGVPTFIFQDQLYWGLSDLALIEAILQGQPTPPSSVANEWAKEVKPSANRNKLTGQDK